MVPMTTNICHVKAHPITKGFRAACGAKIIVRKHVDYRLSYWDRTKKWTGSIKQITCISCLEQMEMKKEKELSDIRYFLEERKKLSQ